MRRRFAPREEIAASTQVVRTQEPPAGRRHIRVWPLWLALAAVILAGQYQHYFVQPQHEWGDAAANALQIRQAKTGQELYGNYSRWGFHHPGPAFFYAYAAGELLLFDLLKVVPAPANAHGVAAVLVQTLFFAWSLAIVVRRIGRPLVLPLLIGLAALHFGTVNFFQPNSAFQSTWPPHVLLFPFLCLIVSAASFASGSNRDCIPMVLAGCMLAHGHVAQPLFVVSLTLLAFGGFLLVQRRLGVSLGGAIRKLATRQWAAAVVIVVFLVPLVLDALKGDESNLQRILHHFTSNSGDRKTWEQSMLYYAAFYCHVINPERYCDQITPESYAFLRERWGFIAGWVALGCSVVVLWRAQWSRIGDATSRFLISLLLFFVAASALTLVWGKLQNGGMANFNSYFNYAILFLPLVLFAALLSLALPSPSRPSVLGASSVAALLLFLSASFNLSWRPPPLDTHSEQLHQTILTAAERDHHQPRTKFLWAPDVWPEAARVALALQRAGYRFAVPLGWGLIFGKQHETDLQNSLARGETTLWRIKSSGTGPGWLQTSPAEVVPGVSEITFSMPGGNARSYAIQGWDINEGGFAWSVGRSGLLWFAPAPADSDIRVEMDVIPSGNSQRMSVAFNNRPANSIVASAPGTVSFVIPREHWNERPFASLTFEFPDAKSPQELGISSDPRQIGLGFVRIRFVPQDAQ